MPPDHVDILDPTSPRFNCASRFLGAARDIGVSVPTLTTVLNQRNGSLHRYWKIGMTSGSTDESQWPLMHDGRFVSIGWHEYVPDLSKTIAENRSDVKRRIRDWLLPTWTTDAGVATRKAGEILYFADAMPENDLVLAVEGQKARGIGRISGPYEYDGNLDFHTRSVEWLLVVGWQLPASEGPKVRSQPFLN